MNIIGSNKTIRGNRYTVVGSNATVYGHNNTITGSNATVYGNNNTITGSNVNVNGHNNKITGSNCFVKGNNNIITGSNNRIVGGFGNIINRGSGRSSTVTRGGSIINNFHSSSSPKVKKKNEVQYVEGPIPSDIQYDIAIEDNDDDTKSCIICMSNIPCCIAIPCMHLSYCIGCAQILCFGQDNSELKAIGNVKCSECMQEVTAIKRTFN